MSKKKIESQGDDVLVLKIRNCQQQYIYHMKLDQVNYVMRNNILCSQVLEKARDEHGDKFDNQVYVMDFFALARKKDIFLEDISGVLHKIVVTDA